MTEAKKELVWLHRRHAGFPSIKMGFVLVSEEEAKKLINSGCAQHHGTDVRKLKKITWTEPYSVADLAPADPPEEPRRKPVKTTKRVPYKRRDMTAER